MINKPSFLRIFFVFIIISFTTACSLTSASDDENEALKQQIYLLETQNALLQENLKQQPVSAQTSPAEIQVPPPPAAPTLFVNAVTPTPESLPTTPTAAGQPIIFDNWSMTVSKEIEKEDYSKDFGISILVRNLGDSTRLFRYILAGVNISDDQGNIYSPVSDYLCEEHMNIPKNLEVPANDSRKIFTATGFRNCQSEDGLHMFQGPISLDAKQLIVEFTDFGPFDGVEVIIDL